MNLTTFSSNNQSQNSNESFTNGMIIKITIALTLFLAILMFFIATDPKAMITGLAFGTVFSILNFRLLHLTLQKSLAMTPNKARSYVTSRYILRYAIAGTMLYVAITNENIHVLGAILGLLIIKGVIFGLNFRESMQKGKNLG